MKTYSTAYAAASAHATRHDKRDEFNENMLDYIDKLVFSGVIVEWPNENRGSPDWIVKDGSNWYLFHEDGSVDKGPFATKKKAMRKVPDESAKYRDTSVYYLPKYRGYVAKRNEFEAWS